MSGGPQIFIVHRCGSRHERAPRLVAAQQGDLRKREQSSPPLRRRLCPSLDAQRVVVVQDDVIAAPLAVDVDVECRPRGIARDRLESSDRGTLRDRGKIELRRRRPRPARGDWTRQGNDPDLLTRGGTSVDERAKLMLPPRVGDRADGQGKLLRPLQHGIEPDGFADVAQPWLTLHGRPQSRARSGRWRRAFPRIKF